MSASFELRSLPLDRNRGRLYLLQLPFKTEKLSPVDAPTTIARIDGTALKLAQPAITTVLEDDAAQFVTSDRTLPLTEEQAIRIGLIFNVVSSLRSGEKAQQVIDGIKDMPETEAGFWLNKLKTDTTDNSRKALVVMFTGAL